MYYHIYEYIFETVYTVCSFPAAMEPILDELQNNDVDIDMRTLSHHVNCLLERHEAVYNQIILVRFGSKRVISVE